MKLKSTLALFLCVLPGLVNKNVKSMNADSFYNKGGQKNWQKFGQHLDRVAIPYLSKDYVIGELLGTCGNNGLVRYGYNKKNGKKCILKFCSSTASRIDLFKSGLDELEFRDTYSYLGELELCRRYNRSYEAYCNACNYDKESFVKKYPGVNISPNINKIINCYVFGIGGERFKLGDWNTVVVLENIPGETLEKYVEKNKYNDRDVLNWLLKVLDILKPLHEKGWHHLDLNLSNVIRKDNGDFVLIDLGRTLDLEDLYLGGKARNQAPRYNYKQVIGNDFAQIGLFLRSLGYKAGNVGLVDIPQGYCASNNLLKQEISKIYNNSENCDDLYDKLIELKKEFNA